MLKELAKEGSSLTSLSEKVCELGRQFFPSQLVFPLGTRFVTTELLEFLVDYLERLSFEAPRPRYKR